MAETEAERRERFRELFPEGIPRLWCPTISHYDRSGSIDAERASAHLESIAPHIGGILLPGSTGDGWDQTADEKRALISTIVAPAARLGLPVLIGVLERTVEEMHAFVDSLTGIVSIPGDAVGIVVCAPTGADRTESELSDAFATLLDRGLPTVLYQLPQITENEFSADTAAALAERYPNFVMLKDSSGSDAVAKSGRDFRGVFLVRGAELAYARWIAPSGPYDGFLLSTANWIAPALRTLVDRPSSAADLSQRVDHAVSGAFALVSDVPVGNPFANSAKLMDHVMAYGWGAADVPGPRLRDGWVAPADLVAAAVELARDTRMLPDRGYLSAQAGN